mmetsp:Transcript_30740/g.67123  ORF Transcript_30740/g.67123 Transcript_30740/m.67123 type:complete len:464 (-) Transcript_30740:395-1786(-)|eukprot:CAMPEP_0118933640 /NCGR_PEP_ID=MMETSP1169-20130426/12101_1 /TAXON_ID=36882 /ORGANISM="Pyramimonas obovata, Strain CCMP722" /LENGTH=463 /DNA_ID=CAMNT_0006876429 /DNA_START=316 /DNA_END=1707 /DNA_ORIENTATION=+
MARVPSSSTRDAWPFMSAEVLRKTSPSTLKHNIDEKRQTAYRTSYCEYLKKAGMELKFPQLTIATAVVFCHRFFTRQSFGSKENDVKVIATACLFLAGKVEETPKPLNEVITKTYVLRHEKERKEIALERIKRKEVYEAEKEKILVAERRVLHALEFIFNVEHPYKHVLLIVKKQAESNKEIAQVAWNFINDSLRTKLSLQYDACKIAVTAVHLASKFLKANLGQTEGSSAWYTSNYSVQQAELEDISNQILDLYQQSGNGASQSQISSTSASGASGAVSKNSPSSRTAETASAATPSTPAPRGGESRPALSASSNPKTPTDKGNKGDARPATSSALGPRPPSGDPPPGQPRHAPAPMPGPPPQQHGHSYHQQPQHSASARGPPSQGYPPTGDPNYHRNGGPPQPRPPSHRPHDGSSSVGGAPHPGQHHHYAPRPSADGSAAAPKRPRSPGEEDGNWGKAQRT